MVLRTSPLAHQAWLRLVDGELDLSRLPKPEYDTQTAALTRGSDQPPDAAVQPIRGISVLQAADAEPVSGPVAPSERRRIYDGVVRYGDELVLVVEVKFVPPGNDQQARDINLGDVRITLDATAREVDWRALLEAWAGLVEFGHATGAERVVISDFLEYVERRHERLGPFNRLRLCGRSEYRVLHRLRSLLQEVTGAPTSISYHYWPHVNIEIPGQVTPRYVFLRPIDLQQTGCVELLLYPADTLSLARRLFAHRPQRLPAVLALRERGWRVTPNFHLGYIRTGYAFCDSPCGADAYCEYWASHIEDARERRREEWPEHLAALARAGIVPDDYAEKVAKLPVWMARLHPRPGLELRRAWTFDEAVALDDSGGGLRNQIAEAVSEGLCALGESALPARP